MIKYTLDSESGYISNIDLDQWCRDTGVTIDSNPYKLAPSVPQMQKVYDPSRMTVNYYMSDGDQRVAYSHPIGAGAPDEFDISEMLRKQMTTTISHNATCQSYEIHPTMVVVMVDKDDNDEFVELKKKYFSTFEDAIDYENKVRNKLEEMYSQEWGTCSSIKGYEGSTYGTCAYKLRFTCDYLKKTYKIIRTNALW